MKAGSREKYSTMPPSLLDYAAAAGVAALAATFYARYARRPQPSPPRSVAVETAPEKASLPLPDSLHDFELESAHVLEVPTRRALDVLEPVAAPALLSSPGFARRRLVVSAGRRSRRW